MSLAYLFRTENDLCHSLKLESSNKNTCVLLIIHEVTYELPCKKRGPSRSYSSMATDKIAALRVTVLFGSLRDEELRALASRCTERKLSRDEILFIAGEEARGLYVVVSGAVRAFRAGADGREQVIHTERAGAILADVPVFDDGTYPATAVADEDSVVLFIAKGDVRAVCLEHPTISLAALKMMAGRLRRHAELVEALSLREVGQRIARLLLTEAESRGKRSTRGITFDLIMNNGQIAARVGSVREVVSRALARLQQDGLILLENRRVTIPHEELLAEYSGES
jgi:CRP-like cAMP-binding protein